MLAAARAMRGRAEAALADLVKATAPKDKAGAASRHDPRLLVHLPDRACTTASLPPS
jgi:hypothetical protein